MDTTPDFSRYADFRTQSVLESIPPMATREETLAAIRYEMEAAYDDAYIIGRLSVLPQDAEA